MVDEIFQMEMKRIALVKERYLKRLMQYPNVIGVGVGFKEISGEEVRVPCIVVYVEEKVPVGSLKPEHVIPKSIEGIPTDVKVMKRPRALTLVSTEEKNPWTSKHRPCPAGVSVGEESITAGCIPKGYPVLLEDGIKDISMITVGDRVITANGIEQVIWSGSRRYTGELVCIRPYFIPEVLFTPNHPLLVSEKIKEGKWLVGFTEPTWKVAEEVTTDDYLLIPRLKSRGLEIEKELAEFLGWYVSEGSITKVRNTNGGHQYKVRVALKNPPRELEKTMHWIAERYTKNGRLFVTEYKNGIVEYQVCSKKLYSWLEKNAGKGARNKRIPRVVLESTEERMIDFLEKLTDGDGYRDRRENRDSRTIYTTSDTLAYQLLVLANKLGYMASLRKRRVPERTLPSGRRACETYCWEVTIDMSNKVRRRYYKKTKKYFLVPIRRVGRVWFDGIVYNFATPSKHYCVPFISHNTLGNWSRIISNTYGRDLRGRIIGETNWHVLGEVNCRKGGRVLQPAPYDGGRVDRDLIGTILDYEKVETLGSGNCPFAKSAVEFLNWLARLVGSRHKFYTKVEVWNELDTGIFLVDDGDVLPEIYSIGVPKGVREATVGMTVQKSGRTTHHTTGGVIKDTHWSGQVLYSNGISLFRNQILIYKSGFSSGGDSGSTILDMDGYIVGRLFAGGGEWTIANHYTKILERYPIKPITEEDLR